MSASPTAYEQRRNKEDRTRRIPPSEKEEHGVAMLAQAVDSLSKLALDAIARPEYTGTVGVKITFAKGRVKGFDTFTNRSHN